MRRDLAMPLRSGGDLHSASGAARAPSRTLPSDSGNRSGRIQSFAWYGRPADFSIAMRSLKT